MNFCYKYEKTQEKVSTSIFTYACCQIFVCIDTCQTYCGQIFKCVFLKETSTLFPTLLTRLQIKNWQNNAVVPNKRKAIHWITIQCIEAYMQHYVSTAWCKTNLLVAITETYFLITSSISFLWVSLTISNFYSTTNVTFKCNPCTIYRFVG